MRTHRPDPHLRQHRATGARRARWKIENEGFNTLKNQGYHLEHNFGHGDQHLSEAFFTLNLLAFFMHQIFELVDGLYQRVRTFFSSRRAFWDERSAFAVSVYLLMLARMNSPPQPLPPYQDQCFTRSRLVPRRPPSSRVPTTTMPHNFARDRYAAAPAAARSEPHPESARLHLDTWPCRRSQTFSSGQPFTETRHSSGIATPPAGNQHDSVSRCRSRS